MVAARSAPVARGGAQVHVAYTSPTFSNPLEHHTAGFAKVVLGGFHYGI
jgi:hypothetical protein